MQTDRMKLQLWGFVLFMTSIWVAIGLHNRLLSLLPMIPFTIMCGANCFREKFFGTLPKSAAAQPYKRFDTKKEFLATRAETRANIARYDRFQLTWGGVYAVGESAVAAHTLMYVLQFSVATETAALSIVLAVSLLILYRMFQRAAQ